MSNYDNLKQVVAQLRETANDNQDVADALVRIADDLQTASNIMQPMGRVADTLGKLGIALHVTAGGLRTQQRFLRMQCEVGLQCGHECAAYYSLASIYGRLVHAAEQNNGHDAEKN